MHICRSVYSTGKVAGNQGLFAASWQLIYLEELFPSLCYMSFFFSFVLCFFHIFFCFFVFFFRFSFFLYRDMGLLGYMFEYRLFFLHYFHRSAIPFFVYLPASWNSKELVKGRLGIVTI
jgi:hypothetical protein